MQALKDAVENRFPSLLPPPHVRIRGSGVFKEKNSTGRLQYSRDAPKRFLDRRNRAQGQSADHRIDAGGIEGDANRGSVQEVNMKTCSRPLCLRKTQHSSIRFECVKYAHFCRIVMTEIGT